MSSCTRSATSPSCTTGRHSGRSSRSAAPTTSSRRPGSTSMGGRSSRIALPNRRPRKLERYHEVEPEVQADATRSYRQVMTDTMRLLGAPAGEAHGLAEALPSWRAFPEVHAALEEARGRGWKLGVLSNTDDDYIAASQVQIGITFDEVIVAQ